MRYCSRCFKRKCKCKNTEKKEIDYLIYPAVYELNRKGYRTLSSTAGTANSRYVSPAIRFIENLPVDIDSEFVRFETYQYNGLHVRKNTVVMTDEMNKYFRKRKTDKTEFLKRMNREFYLWAKSLPVHILSSDIEAKYFPDEYFCRDRDLPDSSPWMFLKPGTENGSEVVRDYEYAVSSPAISTEFFAGSRNQILRISEQEKTRPEFYDDDPEYPEEYYKDNGLVSSLKNALEFQPKTFIFGQNTDLNVEVITIGDCRWLVSYTSLQDTLYLEEELEDYIYDHRDMDALTIFQRAFEIIKEKGTGFCIFSTEDTVIVFTDRKEFAYRVSSEYTVFLTGEIDYRETELKHVVPSKEVFVFTNGILLLRKEF